MDNFILDDSTEIFDSIVGIYRLINSNLQELTRIDSFSAIRDDVIIEVGSKILTSRKRPHWKTVKGRSVNEGPHK